MKTCSQLLAECQTTKPFAHKLTFLGVDGMDVYNTSHAFEWDGEIWIAGRVERRKDEIASVRLFRRVSEYTYEAALPDVEFRQFQDPFVTVINGELVLGGVQIDTNPLHPTEIINWRTCFFKGKHLENLKLFAVGPNKMKDIRLGQMLDGRIAVFTRPIWGEPAVGRIGFTIINALDELCEQIIEDAPTAATHFSEREWGGVNQVISLADGRLGILGHIAYRTEQKTLHYHVMSYIHDPFTNSHTAPKILLSRSMLPPGDFKRPELTDVLFTGGIADITGEKTYLYTGVSDCETWCVELNPLFND